MQFRSETRQQFLQSPTIRQKAEKENPFKLHAEKKTFLFFTFFETYCKIFQNILFCLLPYKLIVRLDKGFSTFCYLCTPKSILKTFAYPQIQMDSLCVPPKPLFWPIVGLFWYDLKFFVPPGNCLRTLRGTRTPGLESLD